MNEEKINTFYTYLQSTETARDYLYHCYQSQNMENKKEKSYLNAGRFIYYLDHGLTYFKTGKKVNQIMQPLIFFYGMVNLIKALLITTRPHYPESTKTLAHGLSARKRKKKQYTFLHDEVRAQKDGLFPYFAQHLFAIDDSIHNKYVMKDLLSLIPELRSLFQLHGVESCIKVGALNKSTLTFAHSLLDDYNLTAQAFIKRMKPFLPEVKKIYIHKENIQFEINRPLQQSRHPFYIHQQEQTIYFPTSRKQFFPVSELMIHYLLLYNLSMICRYETEWWGDLLTNKTESDYPFILKFLEITMYKTPLLIGHELLHKYSTY